MKFCLHFVYFNQLLIIILSISEFKFCKMKMVVMLKIFNVVYLLQITINNGTFIKIVDEEHFYYYIPSKLNKTKINFLWSFFVVVVFSFSVLFNMNICISIDRIVGAVLYFHQIKKSSASHLMILLSRIMALFLFLCRIFKMVLSK